MNRTCVTIYEMLSIVTENKWQLLWYFRRNVYSVVATIPSYQGCHSSAA